MKNEIYLIREIENLISLKDYSSALNLSFFALEKKPVSPIFFTLMLRSFKKNKRFNDHKISNSAELFKAVAKNFVEKRAESGLENFTVWPIISLAYQEIMRSEYKQGKYDDLISFLYSRTFSRMVKPKIILLTCIWQRHDLTQAFFEHYNELKKNLSHKVDLQIFAVGSEGDVSREICEQADVFYIEHPNEPLSAKWQAGITALKNHDFDALVIMGSDDFISADVFDIYISNIKNNTLFFGFQDLYIYDTKKRNLIYWYGYGVSGVKKSQSHRIGESIGLGRMLHRGLLEFLDFDLWGDVSVNKSLDNLMQKKVMKKTGFLPVMEKNSLCISKDDGALDFGLVLSSFKEKCAFGIDVKHTINVTNMSNYCFSDSSYCVVKEKNMIVDKVQLALDDVN